MIRKERNRLKIAFKAELEELLGKFMLCEKIFYVIFAVYETLDMLLWAKIITKGFRLSFKINPFLC